MQSSRCLTVNLGRYVLQIPGFAACYSFGYYNYVDEEPSH